MDGACQQAHRQPDLCIVVVSKIDSFDGTGDLPMTSLKLFVCYQWEIRSELKSMTAILKTAGNNLAAEAKEEFYVLKLRTFNKLDDGMKEFRQIQKPLQKTSLNE